MKEKTEIGKRIKQIRLSLGDTTEGFGKRFDPPANRGLVSGWENGRYLPNPERLKQIAKLAGITVEDLLNNEKKSYYEEIEDIVIECLSEYGGAIDDEFKKVILNETLVRFFQSSIRNKDKVKRFVNRFLNGEHPYWQAYEIFFKSLNINTDDKEDIALQQLKQAVDNFQFITFPPNDLVTIYFKNQLEGANINDGKSLYNYYLERYNGLEEYSQIIETEKNRNNQDILEDIELELINLKEMLNKMDQYMTN